MRRLPPAPTLTVAAALMAWTAFASLPADAQVPGVLGIEVRAGSAVGSFAPTGAGLEFVPGPAWALSATWGPRETIAGYATYSANTFGCDGAFCRGYDVSFVSRGLSLGVRAHAPLRLDPWLQGGLLLHEFEQRWEGSDAPEGVKSGANAGLETGAGFTARIGHRLSLLPGVHLGFLPTRGDDGVTDRAFFASLALGARMRF
jgi:hypothetical protein